jgi:uncharacterized protein
LSLVQRRPNYVSLRVAVAASALLAAIVLSITATAAAALVTIPDQDTPVIDQAGVLDAGQRQQLVDLLHALKERTGAQVKVLTVPSLAGEDIFAFTQRHYDLWKLGAKRSDKGALIVLAPTERKVRIEPGYGLEGVLPDSWCGTTTRNIAQKYFVRRQFAQGLIELTQAIAQRVIDDAAPGNNALPARNGGDDSDLIFDLVMLAFVLFFLFTLCRQWKNRNGGRRWSGTAPGWGWNSMPGIGGSSGGGWTGGDWSGGGGGGGWSSGGSDFGGGGSSGGAGGGASW